MPQPLRSPSHKQSSSEKQLITRACDTCRKKKIRCDPISNSDTAVCAQCVKSKSHCHFTPISVLRSRKYLARDREREREKDRRVEELEKRLASIESQCGAILPAEEWRPRGRQYANGDEGSTADSGIHDIAGRDEYHPTYTTTHALGGSFLGSAPEESASGSQTSPTNTATTTESQRRVGRGDAGAGESEEEFLEKIERIRSMKAGGIGAGESVEQFMKRMERIRSGDCGGCTLISSGSEV